MKWFWLLFFPGLAMAGLPFATTVVAYRPVNAGYAVEALVEAGRESTLAAQVAGRIVELRVDAGDAVKPGQLLARIDDSEARNSIVGNQALVAQAQASLTNAQAQLDRARQLVARKFMSPSALDKAQADQLAAEGQLAAARSGVAQSSTVRGFSAITAPFGGLVSARLAQVGEMASLGRPLLTLFAPETLRVVASVPQEKLIEVKKSGHAQVEFPAMGQWLEASTVTVLPSADSRTHISQVRVTLPKMIVGIYPGMFARVHFPVGEAKKMLVPATAIVRRSEVTAVYVVANERVQLRQVRLGEAIGDQIEVLAGLEAGTRIALEPIKAGIYIRGLKAGDSGLRTQD